MLAEPLYQPGNLHCAYQLRYGWTGWPSRIAFPTNLAAVLPGIAPEWEKDGIRVLESSVTAEKIQLTLSTTPQVSPINLSGRVKGRLQHHCRSTGIPVDFSRKLALRSLGDPTRTAVEAYVRGQVPNVTLADEQYREMLGRFTVVNPEVGTTAVVGGRVLRGDVRRV
jgi:hypothetical protein